jgi:hypothetical protein
VRIVVRGALAAAAVAMLAACGPTHSSGATSSVTSAVGSSTTAVPGVHELTRTYDFGSVTSLVVDGGAGNVTVTGGSRSTAQVTEHLYYSHQVPDTTQAVSSGTLTAGYSCPIQVTCLVSYEIAVPGAVSVKANTRAGAIRISDVTGSLTASAGAGSIHVTSIASPKVSLTTLAGAVTASFTAAPTSVTARSHLGFITIQVPGDVSYRVSTQTVLGKNQVSVPRSDDASRSITASTDVGGITVEPN